MSNAKSPLIFFLFLIALFFAVCPWFVNANAPAKAYLFFFGSLFFLLKTSLTKPVLVLDSSSPLWLLFFLFLLLSAVHSKDPASAFKAVAIVCAAALWFLSACNAHREKPGLEASLMYAVLWIALLFAILGLGQFYDHALRGRPSHMVIPYLLPVSWWPRISGPFGQANFHALIMVTGLCAHAYMLFSQKWDELRCWSKASYFFVAGLFWLNFFLADSRGGNVGLAVLLTILTLFLYRQRVHLCENKFLLRGVVFCLCALLSLGVGQWMIGTFVAGEKLVGLQIAQSGSISSRINTWTASLLMFADHPLMGIGLDNFKGYLSEYQVLANRLLKFEFEDMLYTRWAHSEYLQVLAEGGLFGCLALLLILVSLGRRVYRNLKSTSELRKIFLYLSPIPFLVQAAFDWPLRHPSLLALFLTLLAFSLPHNNAIEIQLTHGRKWLIASCLLLCMGGGVWAVYWEVQAGVLKSKISDAELVEDNLDRMRYLAGNPVSEFAVINQGVIPLIKYAIKNNDKAMASALLPLLDRGIYLEGAYWQWYNKARILLVAGKEAEAKVAIRKALDLNPVFEPAWGFLHYLDVLNASRALGKPVESFYPKGVFNLELPNVGDFTAQSQ